MENTAKLMNDWSDKKFVLNTKFSADTMKAVHRTSITITKAIPALLTMSRNQNLGIDYICTAKLNLTTKRELLVDFDEFQELITGQRFGNSLRPKPS